NAAVLNGANNKTGQTGGTAGGIKPLTATNAAALNGAGATTGDNGGTNSLTATNAAVANGPGTATGTSGEGTSGEPAPASGSIAALNPGTAGGAGGGGLGTDLPATAAVTVETNGNPNGPLVSGDATHTDGIPGQTDAAADVNLTPATTALGDTVSNVTNNAGDTIGGVTNNGGDTITNVNNTANGGTEAGGGGSVAIGGFSGAYAAEDWHARCIRVLREPRHYAKKLWRHCRELVRKEHRKTNAREAGRR
ncbi:MAG TPA: hypothetical protein VIJ67_13500, partial [Pseudolabrys sp.]